MMTKTIGMNQRLLLLAVCILWVVGSFPAPISYEQALTKATAFLTARNKQYGLRLVVDGTARLVPRKVRTTANQNAQPLYVFNIGEGNGFVILSGDDRTPSILGYSDKGSFDYATLPDNARAWIDGYTEQIACMKEGYTSDQSDDTVCPAIDPLLTSRWNQLSPYNEECPTFFTGTKSVTGCVATAMAQVLYFHRNKSGSAIQTEIPSYDCNRYWTGYGQVHVDAVPEGSLIDWENMVDDCTSAAIIVTEVQKKAVADLMRYCGAAVEMDYADQWNGGSSAAAWTIASALGKYFGYSADVAIKERCRFTDQNWNSLIYRELKEERPVIMSGCDSRTRIGHAFVCDGFDGNGYYHFNWGWGGLADGYYLLSNLMPTSENSSGWDETYNDDLIAVVGLHPDDGSAPFVERPCLTIVEITSPVDDVEPRDNESGYAYPNYDIQLRNCTTRSQGFETAVGWYRNGIRIGCNALFSYNKFTIHDAIRIYGQLAIGADFEQGTYQLRTLSRLKGSDEWLEDNGSDRLYIKAVVEESQITFSIVRLEEGEVDPDEHNHENEQEGGHEDDPPQPTITLTAKSYIREYGEENPEFGFSSDGQFTGFPNVICEATAQSPAGEYPIVISRGSILYENCVFVEGTLTITKAPVTVSVGNYTRKQGEENPEFTIEYEGFKNSETEDVLTLRPFVTTNATKESEPGLYELTITDAEAENYMFNYVSGKLTILEADPIMLIAMSYTREYGEDNPIFEFATEGAVLDGEPIIECEATVESTVGTYDIIIKKGDVKNCNDTYVNGILTITKAPLKVAVKDVEREQGEENPQFELVYEGWKLQDTESVLIKKPVITTTATKDSPVGEYVIVVNGGESENYELSYQNGKLTVTVPSVIAMLLKSGRPFDVYDLSGRKVRHQVTTLKGLPSGAYIVNGKKVFI